MAEEPTLYRRIQAIGRTRSIAAEALKSALTGIYPRLSESTICERWQTALTSHSTLLPQGWYLPPPGGVSVLIGRPPYYTRINYVSLRDRSSWPNHESRFQSESLIYLYASPVDRTTAMIGDFAITIYSGNDRAIKDHIATCFQITAYIADYAAVGMEMRELYSYADHLIRSSGLVNSAQSTTDVSGRINIGHTVPWSYTGYDPKIWSAIQNGDGREVAGLISRARVFLTAEQTLRITDDIAFTVEPQMMALHQPKVSFHVIVAFHDGLKQIFANYIELLADCNMIDYLPAGSVRILTANESSGLVPRARLQSRRSSHGFYVRDKIIGSSNLITKTPSSSPTASIMPAKATERTPDRRRNA